MICIRVAKTGIGKSVPNNLIFNQVVPKISRTYLVSKNSCSDKATIVVFDF